MAQPVEFRRFTPQDSRGDLIRRLQGAPEAHAEALLSLYELVEKLHEKGLIDVANGLLSASPTVVDRLVDVVSSKQAVTGLRLGLMVTNLLETIDTDRIHTLLTASAEKPPSLLKLGRDTLSADARRGLATGIGLLNVLGAARREKGVEPASDSDPLKSVTVEPRQGNYNFLKILPMLSTEKATMIMARFLVATIFVMNGLDIISQTLAVNEMVLHGVSLGVAHTAVLAARALQLVAACGLIFGLYPRLASLGLIIFLIPATLMAHPFWYAASTPLYPVQLINFFKNVCMCGGLLFIAATRNQPTAFPHRRSSK